MFRYFVHFTCRVAGQPDTGYLPIQHLLRDQGIDATEVVLTDIKVA
jgi:hypothetical protein